MPAWRVVLAQGAATRITGLAPDVKRSLGAALRALAADPYLDKELVKELTGLRSYRVRRYRIVHEIAVAGHELRVIAVGHRSTIYEELAAERLSRRR